MVTKPGTVIAQAVTGFPQFLEQKHASDRIYAWIRGEQDTLDRSFTDRPMPAFMGGDARSSGSVYKPYGTTDEYADLESRSPNAIAGLIVRSLSQTLYIDNVSRGDSTGKLQVWDLWQQNAMDAKQVAQNKATIGYGVSYASVREGISPFTGQKSAVFRSHSPRKMCAFYDDDMFGLEYPAFALRATENVMVDDPGAWNVEFWDETAVHRLSCVHNGDEEKDWTYIDNVPHSFGITPIIRFDNNLDIDGSPLGEIQPIFPLLRRVDQDTFDRLIVQRFGAWKVRYIAGMAEPKDRGDEAAKMLKLKMQDILIASDKDTKFGTLDATDTAGFLAATDHDLRMISAITQVPPHHLLGLSANLQAEALAAAEAGLQRKGFEFRVVNGERYEQMLRLGAFVMGWTDEYRAFDMQVRWRDTESRSMMQTAQALGQLATTLHVPVELLWEMIPNWTEADVSRAKSLATTSALDQLIQASIAAQGSQTGVQGANGQGGAQNDSSAG